MKLTDASSPKTCRTVPPRVWLICRRSYSDNGLWVSVPTGLIFTFCGIRDPVTQTYAYPGWPCTGTTFSTLCVPASPIVATPQRIDSAITVLIMLDIFIFEPPAEFHSI